MSRDDHLEFDGRITDAMGGGQYKVLLTSGSEIRAKLGGKMKQNHIRVIPGDVVKVAVSPYDMTHGMITFRARK